MIDHFTKEQFESALPVDRKTGRRMWEETGVQDGEYCYRIVIGGIQHTKVYPGQTYPGSDPVELAIRIRSSVRADGTSADTGENSIRCWLSGFDGKPYAYKTGAYITRKPGWEKRLTEKLRQLYRLALILKPCYACGNLMQAGKVKKVGPNKGKVFQKCRKLDCGCGFEWIDVDVVNGVKKREAA